MDIPALLNLLKTRFILVLAPPKTTEHDGYSRRIQVIDSHLKPEKLIYVFPDSDQFWGSCQTYRSSFYFRLNGRNPLHHVLFLILLLRAKVVYCHSIFGVSRKLARIGLALIQKKIILDVHGLVPEEALAQGQQKMSKHLDQIEDWIFHQTSLFVVVTNKMKNYILEKYPDLSKKDFLVLPIMAENPALGKSDKDARLVVYSGGIQKWQRIDLMNELIQAQPNLNYLILTPDQEEFRKLLPPERFPHVSIDYLEGEQYDLAIQKATFGFMLRNNDALNQVACPTKMYDYLSLGVIPIVDFEEIGDFKDLGYISITRQQFLQNPSYSETFLLEARQTNRKLATTLVSTAQKSIEELKRLLSSAS